MDGRMPYSGQQQPRNRWANKGANQRRKPKFRPSPPPQQQMQGVPNFLPQTPDQVRNQRYAGDDLSRGLMGIANQRALVGSGLNLARTRMGTDKNYANLMLNNNLADRGVLEGSVDDFLRQRDINLPYGRREQDLIFGANQDYSNLAGQEGELYNQYNTRLLEGILGSANSAIENPTLASQFNSDLDFSGVLGKGGGRQKPKPRRKKRRK